MTRTYRLLGMLAVLALPLAACNSGTKAGDTNVELGSNKKVEPENEPSRVSNDSGDGSGHATNNGDSLAAGLTRDTTRRPTGKQIFNKADRAVDRNHDGIAD
ncbi:MAG: hypothetical protein ACRYF0_06345 [Janthinobacterium lividum]